MRSLIDLEKALLEENVQDVSHYLEELDKKTGNDAMRKAGGEFGFKTLEINGMVMAHMASASAILGYSNVSGLTNLLSAFQIMTYKIGWFIPEVKTRLRETFDLNEKDSQATFITWDAFLVAGMHGQNAAARRVKIYLLQAERAYRINLATKDIRDNEEIELKKDRAIESIIGRIGKTTDSALLEVLYERLDRLAGRRIKRPPQLNIDFDNSRN